VESAGVALKFAQERLNGEQKRREAGLSQNYLVLQRQMTFHRAVFRAAGFDTLQTSHYHAAKGDVYTSRIQ
jgi:hypothetical protein